MKSSVGRSLEAEAQMLCEHFCTDVHETALDDSVAEPLSFIFHPGFARDSVLKSCVIWTVLSLLISQWPR